MFERADGQLSSTGDSGNIPQRNMLGEYSALWGERERVVSCIYRQQGSYIYTACCNVYMHHAQKDIYTNSCIGSLGRVSSPISLSASLIFPPCLCSAVSAACRALSLVLVCAVASSGSIHWASVRAPH